MGVGLWCWFDWGVLMKMRFVGRKGKGGGMRKESRGEVRIGLLVH